MNASEFRQCMREAAEDERERIVDFLKRSAAEAWDQSQVSTLPEQRMALGSAAVVLRAVSAAISAEEHRK